MFTAKNIIDYTTEEDRKKLENRNKYSELYKVLSFFDRVRLSRIDRMIEKITSAIKKESYWDYLHKEFTYKSDFSYDSKENDIVFIVNKVQNRDGEYSYHTGDDFTNREMLFYRKYKDVLDRLAILENKKEQMYEDNKHLINRKFVDFQKAKESLKSVQDYNYTFTRGYLQTIAEDLVKEYGIKSIKDLIFLLNKIDLVSDPESIYKIIVMNGKSKNYKQDLFSWISTYSNPGYNFSEKYYEELFPIHYHKRPDYEQIKLDNMLKLHM